MVARPVESSDEPRRGGTRARRPLLGLSFSEEDFFDVVEEHFERTRSVLAAMASAHERPVVAREQRASGPPG